MPQVQDDALALRGPKNSLTDVPEIRVGHVTLVSGEGPLVPGKGPVRTGVTAIVPDWDVYRDLHGDPAAPIAPGHLVPKPGPGVAF